MRPWRSLEDRNSSTSPITMTLTSPSRPSSHLTCLVEAGNRGQEKKRKYKHVSPYFLYVWWMRLPHGLLFWLLSRRWCCAISLKLGENHTKSNGLSSLAVKLCLLCSSFALFSSFFLFNFTSFSLFVLSEKKPHHVSLQYIIWLELCNGGNSKHQIPSSPYQWVSRSTWNSL